MHPTNNQYVVNIIHPKGERSEEIALSDKKQSGVTNGVIGVSITGISSGRARWGLAHQIVFF
jgi:hypothetical protein